MPRYIVRPFHLLNLPTVVISEVLNHLKNIDICILRTTSRKIRTIGKLSARRKQTYLVGHRRLDLTINARFGKFKVESGARDGTVALYAGYDINRVLDITSDFFDYLDIYIYLYIIDNHSDKDAKKLVEVIVTKGIYVHYLRFDGEQISHELFREMLKCDVNELRIHLRTQHTVELSDIDLMVSCKCVALTRITIPSDYLNVLLKKWQANRNLTFFSASGMALTLDKSIILEGTNSEQGSEEYKFYIKCNNRKTALLKILHNSFRLGNVY